MAYKKKKKSSKGTYGGFQTTKSNVLSGISKGDLNHDVAYTSGLTFTSEVERLIFQIGSDTVRTILPYVRFKYFLWAATPIAQEWYLVKQRGTTLPDMSSSTVLKQYQEDKKILQRGFFVQGTAPPGLYPINGKVTNVVLEKGEYLILFHTNMSATTASGVQAMDMEWRVITQD